MDLAHAEQRLGATLGRYTLTSVLGVGGMATVYKAVHRNGHKVALKLLHPHFATRADVRARFVQEAYTANKIEHPGIVRVIDDDVAPDGSAFMVMDLLEGETLDAWQDREGPMLPPEQVFDVVHQVLDVLVHAHWHGVVHRDLKPENLFRTSDGRIKVLDFGIARVLHESGVPTRTRTGNLLGTPAFMPPEQAQGRVEQIDGRTDLWALGATAFALLSGHYVHEAETVALLNIASGTQEARAVTPLVPGLHADLAAVVDTALRFEKSARWGSARAMQQALETAFEKAFGRSLETPQQVALRASLPSEPVDHATASGRDGDGEVADAPALSNATRVTATSTNGGVVSAQPRGSSPERRRPGRAWIAVALAAGVGIVGLGASRLARDDRPDAALRSSPSESARSPGPSAAAPAVTPQEAPAASAPAPVSVALSASPAAPKPKESSVTPAHRVPPAPALAVAASALPIAPAPSGAAASPAPSAATDPKSSCDPWFILENGKKRRKPWC